MICFHEIERIYDCDGKSAIAIIAFLRNWRIDNTYNFKATERNKVNF